MKTALYLRVSYGKPGWLCCQCHPELEGEISG